MAKMKVYELAKELEIQSKDVITFLQGKGVEVKAAQSSVEDEHIALVKKNFTKAAKTEEKKAAPAKKSADKVESNTKAEESTKTESAAKTEEPKKKKNIIFVSNPHNSKMPMGARNNAAGNGRNGNAHGARNVGNHFL